MGIQHTTKKLQHFPNNLNKFNSLKNSISEFSQHHANHFSGSLNQRIFSTGSSSVSPKRYPSSSFANFSRTSRNFYVLNFKPNRVCAKPSSVFGVFSIGSCSKSCFDGYIGCYYVRWYCDSSLMNREGSVESLGIGRRDHPSREYENPKIVSEVIEVIIRNGDDLEAELEKRGLSLSVSSIIVIFRALSSKKVSLLRFFSWIRQRWPQYGRNADVCSLAISNCGWLGDYDNMLLLLNDFRSNNITLSRRAFDFVPTVISSKPGTLSSLDKLILLLNQVGGSCRSSAICSLIEMFSLLGRFDLCKYVIRKSDKRKSYYNVMVKELCRRGDFEGSMNILDEMRQAGFDLDTRTCNNLFSRFCEGHGTAEANGLLEEFLKRGFQPDELTYEMLICFYFKVNKLDFALQIYDQMVVQGLQPRLTTHVAFIKHYFKLKQYDEAYRYLVSLTDKHKHLGNKFYSLLVNLHRKQQNWDLAHRIVSEMISKGLRPEYNVYQRLFHRLQMSGKENLAKDLEVKLCSLASHSSLE